MTMMQIPGLSGAVDICDITVMIPNGNTRTTLYLLGNAALLCDAMPEDVFNAINADQPYMVLFLDAVGGPIACNAQNALRIVATPDLLGSVWQMEANGGTFTVPNVTVADAITLVNAAPRCGDGGGGGGTYLNVAPLDTLTVVNQPNNVGTLLNGPIFARLGQADNAPDPSSGDMIVITAWVQSIVQSGAQVALQLTGLPAEVDSGSLLVNVDEFVTIGDLDANNPPAPPARGIPYVYYIDVNTLGIGTNQAVVGVTVVQMKLRISYLVAAN